MQQSRNGGGKVVALEQAMIGRHRNGPLTTNLDVGWEDPDAGLAARPFQLPQGAMSRRRTYADGELDVFAAERYFKGAMDGDRRDDDGVAVVVPPARLEMALANASARPSVVVATPVGTRASAASVRVSSATSANSRTTLLRGGHRRRDHREKMCCVPVGALIRSCSGKRSVRVDSCMAREIPGNGAPEPTASKTDWYKELCMQKEAALGVDAGDSSNRGVVAAVALPPNLNLSVAKVASIGREAIREDRPVEFTSSCSRRRSFTPVAPVRANVPANGRVGDAGAGPAGGSNEHEDDDGAGSESSSDLFEIKTLMIDDCPCEPSEASIQWSVATVDPSERGDRVSARWMTGVSHSWRDGERGLVAGRPNRDRPAALQSGCVSHEAIKVSAAAMADFQRARNVA